MNIPFYKYQGTGNDFVMIDNRSGNFPKNDIKLIEKLCDRRYGIGADGLILLEDHPTVNFTMTYFNADGNISTMCGNGGRCIAQFAKQLGIVNSKTVFEAVDGMHEAFIKDSIVSLKMNNVVEVNILEDHVFLDTGSPHHVEMVDNLEDFDVRTKGSYIRYNIYGKEGANVNFVEAIDNGVFSVRTYERGVENETLSCGTGVTAVAISLFETGRTSLNKVMLETLGGLLTVRFTKTDTGYVDVFLEGPATFVFKGDWI